MTKKIPCRVVRSASLIKSSDARLRVNQSDNKSHKFQDTVAVNVRVRRCSSSVREYKAHNPASGTLTYTGRSDIAGASIDDSPTGQVLDCYI